MDTGVSWDYYNAPQIKEAEDKYLPSHGEGDSKATQIITAITKLVYKWYNDGDVFDNTHSLSGWCNDLSSYANWLATYVDGAKGILDRIETCCGAGYEHMLKDLTDAFGTCEYLDTVADQPTVGTIYECDGPYKFVEEEEEDDWWDEEE